MRLLIVDDDQEILNDITTAIKPTGYDCESINNPVKALELYQKNRFDVVITDVRMPEMSGIELLKKIRDFDPNARVIIITAFGDLETAIASINNRAYAFFGKPIKFSELIYTLREIEKEIKNNSKMSVDIKKLKEENKKLKETYGNLFKILDTLR